MILGCTRQTRLHPNLHGKIPIVLFGLILQVVDALPNTDAHQQAELLYKVANEGTILLGQYDQTLKRAMKASKAPKPITPTKPS